MENFKVYTVTWTIEINATSAKDAAEQALRIQRDSSSIATVFDVQEYGKKEVMRIDFDA
jgi:hypothetical protein